MTLPTKSIRQYCRRCRTLVDATQELQHDNGLLVSDRSTCTVCNEELWSWTAPVLDAAVETRTFSSLIHINPPLKITKKAEATGKQQNLW